MKPAESTSVVIWHTTFVMMCLMSFLVIPFDVAYGVSIGMGSLPNMSLVPAALFIAGLVGIMKQTRARNERLFLLAMVAFIAYASIGMVLGRNVPILTISGIAAIWGGIAAGLGAYVITRGGGDVFRTITIWTLIGAIPFFTLPIITWYLQDSFTPKEWMHNLQGFTNVRALGHYVSVAIVCCMTLLAATVAQRRSASVIIGVLVLQIGLFGLLFWSGSRAGLMAIGIMMIMAPLFVRHFSWKLLCLNLSSAIIGAGASALMYIPGSSYSIIKRATPSIRDGSTTSQALDQVSSGRLELYQWVIARIMEKPWFGYGYLPMGDMLGEGATVYHAHNVVLEYALGFGIPVAILVICLIMWIFLRGVVAVRTSESPYILCGLYLALLLPIYSMFSGVLLAPYQYILFGSVLGGLLGTRIAQENPSAPESDAPEKKSIPVDDIMASL